MRSHFGILALLRKLRALCWKVRAPHVVPWTLPNVKYGKVCAHPQSIALASAFDRLNWGWMVNDYKPPTAEQVKNMILRLAKRISEEHVDFTASGGIGVDRDNNLLIDDRLAFALRPRSNIMAHNVGALFLLAVAVFTQTGAAPKEDVPTCGLHSTKGMHDCHCAARVAKIRQSAVQGCKDTGDATAYNTCVRHALAGKDHCSIAERFVEGEDGDDYVYPHGDHIKTAMGEYCLQACSRHKCQCAEEQSCDFH